MNTSETQFVTDDAGQRIAVMVGVDRYQQLLEAVEEIDSVRAFDAAKASGDDAIPFEDAVIEIEKQGLGG